MGDVLIIDPFVSSHEVPENDNGAMDRIVKEWGRVAQRGNGGEALKDRDDARRSTGRAIEDAAKEIGSNVNLARKDIQDNFVKVFPFSSFGVSGKAAADKP